MKKILMSLTLSVSALSVQAMASESVDSAPYQQAFTAHVYESLQEMAAVDLAEADDPQALLQELQLYSGFIARCHMRSMSQYDSKLSQVAYQEVAQGGTYERADELLQGTLLAAISGGGDSAQAVMQAAQRANLTFDACMAEVNQGDTPQ